MNKSVLISIQPKWCELIASGKKTIEVRKTTPKLETPFKCYMYETKNAKGVRGFSILGRYRLGKVIGEFVCDRIKTFDYRLYAYSISIDELIETQLGVEDLNNYGKGKTLYGWHISDLKIYDTPKELREFSYPCRRGFSDASAECKGCRYAFKGMSSGEIYCDRAVLTAPQSWCYVEE